MKAIAVGPTSRSSTPLTPASRAAMVVSVFFDTAYVASSPRARRRSFSAFTDKPRYSVSTAPEELLNLLVSSATAATFSGFAISVLQSSGYGA